MTVARGPCRVMEGTGGKKMIQLVDHRTKSIRCFDATLYINRYSSGLDGWPSDLDVRVVTSHETDPPCADFSQLSNT